MKIPKAVKIMGPHASREALDGINHEHAFECRSRCPARKTPGNSALYPTENMESSEWIVAWHAMKTIEKAMSFLHAYVPAGTRHAVMTNLEVVKLFDDAATIIRDRLRSRPQDSASLQVPSLSIDSDDEDPSQPVIVDDDDLDEDSDDDMFVQGHVRPRPHQHNLPPAQRVAHDAQIDFDEQVQFVMEATGCNRRAAIDALHTHRTAHGAILWLLNR